MDTHVSVPPRALATERRAAVATDERLDAFAFRYFVVSLILAAAGAGWAVLTI